MKKILQNKLYLTTFAVDMLSNFGDILYYLALMAYVLQLSDAKLAISIVSVSETLPILTGFVMGYFADRTPDKVKTIIHTLLLRVGLYLAIGIAMGFEPSLWIVIFAAIINFVSDISGQYENSLFIPLSLRIVADEDRVDFYSFRQAVGSVLYIAFQSMGAVLVGVMSYQAIAWVNAGTFAISALIMMALVPQFKRLLADRPLQVSEARNPDLLKDMWTSMKTALSECMKIPEIRQSMLITPLLNGVFNVMSVLVAVIISQDPDFIIINPVTTLALLTGVNLLGGIVGSVFSMTLLKNWDILSALRLATCFVPILFFCLYTHFIYGVYAMIFLTMIVAATINPKLSALIMNNLPEEKLAMINGGIITYFQLGTILMRLVVSGLILVIAVDTLSLFFIGIGILLIVYIFANRKLAPQG